MNLGERLTRDTYSARLKEGLVKIGVKARRYDSHSGRIGGATMLWEAGYSDAQIMELEGGKVIAGRYIVERRKGNSRRLRVPFRTQIC